MSENVVQLLAEADELFDGHKYDEALAKYEEVLAEQPYQRQAINRVARICALRGRIKRVIETSLSWQESLEQEENYELAGLAAEAVLLFSPHSLEGRLCRLRHVQRTADEAAFVEAARGDARYFVEVGSGDLSIQVLQMALDNYPRNIELAIDLADMNMAQGNLQEAARQFRALANRFEATGKPLLAADAYRRLKVLIPDSLDYLLRLATIYLENQYYEEAIVEFRNVLRIDYTNHEALMGLGAALAKTEQYEAAALAYSKLIAVDAQDVEAHSQLADVYIAQERNEEAIIELLAVGRGLADCKEYAAARDAYARVLELEPNNQVAVREMSNAADALAAQQSRAEKLSRVLNRDKVYSQSVTSRVTGETQASDVAALNEDDLYGGEALDDELLGGDLLGVPDTDEAEPSVAAAAVEQVSRLKYAEPGEDAIWCPVPFLVAEYPDCVPLIRELVKNPPDQAVIAWKCLEKVDSVKSSSDGAESTVASAPKAAAPVVAGPVRSAFGEVSAFADAIASTASGGRTRRSGRWEFVPFRGSMASSEPKEDVADRIFGAQRDGQQLNTSIWDN